MLAGARMFFGGKNFPVIANRRGRGRWVEKWLIVRRGRGVFDEAVGL
jgi:hypothetical protein